MSSPPHIVVVGSLNLDHTFLVDRLPLPGQTVASTSAETAFGGKGANQALAARRAGARVSLIGCVGDDSAGTHYLDHFRRSDISVDAVSKVSGSIFPTGSAFIAVDSSGENTIILNAGANQALSCKEVDAQAELISGADALLFQLECPLESVKRAAEIARKNDVKIIANPSPWNDDFLSAEIPCDYVILNALEAAAFTGVDPFDSSLCTESLVESMGLEAMIVTQGAQATFFQSRSGEPLEFLPPLTTPVDTVGAGDAFAGAFALAIAEGMDYSRAVPFANAAGALATQKVGAQTALPERRQIEELLAKPEA